MITCFANNVKQAYIYIRGEFPHGARILEQAIAEARAANFVGPSILGSGYGCEIYVHRGAGAYICGEETGLIESIEGKRPYPRIKPPYFPAVLGLYQCPTIVNNVETLCHVKLIADIGGAAYSQIGTANNTGTRLVGVSGHVQRPGFFELECGKVTLGRLLNEICGGPLPGRSFKGVIPGGSSAKVLRFGERFKIKQKDGSVLDWGVEDIPLDFDSFAACGSMGGSGGVIVMDDRVNMVEALANLNAFYAHESCGQCTPCREGSLWMKKISSRMVHGEARPQDGELIKSVADQIAGRTICAFGEACAWPTQSFVQKFGDDFKNYAAQKASHRADALTLV
jgi:NADH-quinone oxidoreductase subunit F